MAKQLGSDTTQTLKIIIPSRGDVDWDQDIETLCFVPITTHDHTGNGNGHQIGENALQSSSVTELKIANAAVTSGKIAGGAVTRDKIANDAVDGTKIADNSITTDHIAPDTVIAADIATNAITEDELRDDASDDSLRAVSTNHIKDANVTTAKIADANVTTAKIADSNVTTAKIADSNVTTAKIADSNVTTAKLNDNSVTTDKILNLAVTGDKIANQTITSYKIGDAAIVGGKIAASTITANNIQNLTITRDKMANDSITADKLQTNISGINPVTLSTLADVNIDTVTYSGQRIVRRGNEWVNEKPHYAQAGSSNLIPINNYANSLLPAYHDSNTAASSGLTVSSVGEITITKAGTYKVDVRGNFYGVSSSTLSYFEARVYRAGSWSTVFRSYASYATSSSGSIKQASGSHIDSLQENDIVRLYFLASDSAYSVSNTSLIVQLLN